MAKKETRGRKPLKGKKLVLVAFDVQAQKDLKALGKVWNEGVGGTVRKSLRKSASSESGK